MSGASGEGRADRAALERSLLALRERSREGTLADSLQRLLDATRELFGASGAGFMMVDADQVLASIAWTDDPGRELEQCQQRLGEGPCVETLTFDHVVTTHDLAADERWSRLTAELKSDHVRSLCGMPVRIGGGAVGALNVYRDRPGDWDESEVRALGAYAGLLETVLAGALAAQEREELAEQLQFALDHRVLIERAVGITMARGGIDALAAFNQLRDRARASQRKVVDLAEDVVREVGEVGDAGGVGGVGDRS